MKRTLLEGHVTRDAIDDAMAKAGAMLVNIVAESAHTPPQIVFRTADRSALLHFVFDPRIDAIYALVQGDAAPARDALAALPRVSPESLLARDDARALVLLGVAAGAREREVLSKLASAIEGPDRALADAALTAAAYLGEGAGRDLVREARARAGDEEVRARASRIVLAWGET